MNGIKKLGLVSMMALAGSLAAQATYGKTYGTANAQGLSGEQAAVELSIPAQPVGDALIELALALEVEIAVFSEDAGTLQGRALNGRYNSKEALIALLKGTGLKYKYVNDKTILVGTPERLAKEEKRISTKKPVRVAQNNNEVPNTSGDDKDDEDEDGEQLTTETDAGDTEVVIVTGSHIRGAGPVGSEVFTYDRKDIDELGFATIPEFIQSLPQNFNGGASESTFQLSFENGANENLSGGTGVNLRGLGNVSTLVLLNGQRLAPSGRNGSFVDISMIPLSAVERVEVLTDGASAIYCSDAIGGVVNFILRKDYDGAETRLRYGFAPEGGLGEVLIGQTFGKTWKGG
ncbi:MAG: TonB-dependent receptor, partial [Sphingomonadales bacterium]